MRIITTLFLLMAFLNLQAQENRIVVIGKGLENPGELITEKLAADLRASPAAVIIMGDYLRNAYRVDQDFMAHSSLGKELIAYEGPVYIIPGEMEYGPSQANSIEHLAALEESIRSIDSTWTLLPRNGCAGPALVEVNPMFTLVVINTARFLHEGEVMSFQACDQEDEGSFFAGLEEVLEDNRHKPVFVVGHHPMRTRGFHGGYFPWYQHVLPPVLGSIYAGYRKYIGGLQDISSDRYTSFIDGLSDVFRKHDGVYYLSGHDGYFHYDIRDEAVPRSQIIAGTLGKPEHAKPLKSADEKDIRMRDYLRISTDPGYVLIDLLNLKASPLTYKIAVAYRTADDDLVSVSFYNGSIPISLAGADSVFSGRQADARATLKLRKDTRAPGLLGNNYRQEWETVIHGVPVIDIEEKLGGLEIRKRGGGLQTRSLRLEAGDERQYVLRSVEKFPEAAVPLNLRNTIVEEIIEDQISASHPYGALVIPPLADAAGVYHTNPELVYLPDDPALGDFREDFADGLYIFEERPDDDHWEDAPYFGNAPELVSTSDVLEKLGNDADHFIAEDQVIRSRLFDIWIGDWDRHDDQWRWKKFKDDQDIKHYEPIPRDRDQAFFWSDGRLLNWGSRRWGQPKFQGFHETIRDVAGLSFNARYFDRTFIIQSEREDWLRIAEELQEKLTDEVIEKGIRTFPREIFALHGDEIIRKLKKRRDDLRKYAVEYYEFLSRTVTVTGSNEAEQFEITHFPGDSTLVRKYRIKSKSGEIRYLAYERMFYTDETGEIRIFGREDDDRFIVRGAGKNTPLVRIIGGQGSDSVDIQNYAGAGRHLFIYDTPDTYTTPSGHFRDKRSSRKQVNHYNRYDFKYDYAMPLISAGFNPDDGVFIGGGVMIRKHGFRKDPFAESHNIQASIAPRSASYSITYRGEFIDVFGRLDMEVMVRMDEPSFGDFFYGFGNQTDFNDSLFSNERQFYRVRYSQWQFEPMLRLNRNTRHIFRAGPYYRAVKIRREENTQITDRFIIAYAEFTVRGEESEMPLLDNRRHYTGLKLNYEFNLTDSRRFPRRGIRWQNDVVLGFQLGDERFRHQRLSSNAAFYYTFGGGIKATIAGRIGGQVNFGEYEFYQSARLGGLSNLRGYRKLRFAGDEAFYTNVELRVQMLEIKSILFPALFGFHVYRDQGRVWSDQPDIPVQNPEKAIWHRGLGAGLWLAPLGTYVISADYSRSNDGEDAFYLRMGFFF